MAAIVANETAIALSRQFGVCSRKYLKAGESFTGGQMLWMEESDPSFVRMTKGNVL
jgi:hypothetical protein